MEITKEKWGKFLATALSCTINMADQSFIKEKMAFSPYIPKQTFVILKHMMTCQIRFPAVYVVVVWGLFRCVCTIGLDTAVFVLWILAID